MKVRNRFLLLFAAQALAAALASVIFAFGAIAGESARAEAELGAAAAASASLAPAPPLGDRERLAAALAEAERLRAQAAAGRVFRAQAAIEAAVRIGTFSLAWAALAALGFALASRGFTRRLDELAAGALRAGSDRSFRFPALRDREFEPVFSAFNAMLDLVAAQEERLAEAARLEGWKEVSSFLFHQLRTPLSSVELASRNVSLAAARGLEGAIPARAALEASAASADSARGECARIRALLDRFKSLAGLALGPAEPVSPEQLALALRSRIAPDRASIGFSGDGAALAGDRRMVEEALLNLVVNAAEACPAPPASVFVRSSLESGSVHIEVSDANGPVDPGILARIGRERFSTKSGGTGLGLLFVRRVAALHGGSFEVFAGPDGGFRARLRLPAAVLPAAAGEAADPATASPNGAASGSEGAAP